MGKLFIKIGSWIQLSWHKLKCNWNTWVYKLIVNVSSCPNKKCSCKTEFKK